MSWNPNVPQSNEFGSNWPSESQGNNLALQDALAREHVFPGVQGTTAGVHKFSVTAPPGSEGQIGIYQDLLYWYSNGTLRTLVPPGTCMVFCQAAAPPGWTQVTTMNDRVLRVTSGPGGNIGGNWTLSTVTVQGHILSIYEMPTHSHSYAQPLATSSAAPGSGAGGGSTTSLTGVEGSGLAHTHPGLDNSAGWRPAYTDCIIASKN